MASNSNAIAPVERARRQALRLLEIRPRSAAELRRRLLQKGHPADVVDELLQALSRVGLVDDRQFAIQRAAALGKSKGWGPRRIEFDLRMHGIEEELIVRAVAEAYGRDGQQGVMRRVVERKFGEDVFSPDCDPRIRQRARGFLLRRGFEPHAVDELFG